MIEEPLHLEPEQFDELVSEVMDDLPEEWGPLLDNMAVVVEDEPSEEDLHVHGVGAGRDTGYDPGGARTALLGRYRRTAVPVQFIGGGLTAPTVTVPPEIALFQGPLERASASLDDLRAHVRETLIQEIGRHLGLSGPDEEDDEEDE